MTLRKLFCLGLSTFALLVTSCGGGGGTETSAGSPGLNLTGAHLPTVDQVNSAPIPLNFNSGPPPASADLSTSRYLPPVQNQSLQDCIPFAFGYGLCTFEVALSNSMSADQISRQASPSDLYAKLLVAENEACNSGTSASDALDILVRSGVQNLAQAPYVPGQCVNPSTGSSFGIAGYHAIRPSDSESIKQVLAGGHPVGIAVSLYDDMGRWGSSHHDDSVYSGTSTPSAVNGHGMLLVGYDDAKHAWHMMNSWSTNWGNRGFFWMSYDSFAASARVCYSVDGGGTSVLPDPGTPVIFLNFRALQYTNASMHYLVMPFQFDHAAHVLQARVVFGNVASPWQTINQWLTKSYLWWGSSSTFAAGTYTLELQCQTSSGKPYTLSQSAPLSQGTNPPVIKTTDAMRNLSISSSPGNLLANGHLVKLLPKTKA